MAYTLSGIDQTAQKLSSSPRQIVNKRNLSKTYGNMIHIFSKFSFLHKKRCHNRKQFSNQDLPVPKRTKEIRGRKDYVQIQQKYIHNLSR